MLQHLSTKDNEIIPCHDLFAIENTRSGFKLHAMYFANDLLVRVRLSFQKLLQTPQTSRNKNKPSKTGLSYDQAIFEKLKN